MFELTADFIDIEVVLAFIVEDVVSVLVAHDLVDPLLFLDFLVQKPVVAILLEDFEPVCSPQVGAQEDETAVFWVHVVDLGELVLVKFEHLDFSLADASSGARLLLRGLGCDKLPGGLHVDHDLVVTEPRALAKGHNFDSVDIDFVLFFQFAPLKWCHFVLGPHHLDLVLVEDWCSLGAVELSLT